ncbi:MAG: J domain-containing protein [Theionarchaea archaeon]|nr:J domain-containing protein [Theionarchaea archaeon]
MSAGFYPMGSIFFFYIFFIAMVIVMLYGLWELQQRSLEQMPNPLSAAFLGIPETINLFDEVQAVLRVTNVGKTRLRNVRVICGSVWTLSLEPDAHTDIPFKLDTLRAGNHSISARVCYKQLEVTILCFYHVFLRKLTQKEKYLKILGLKAGASRKDIRRARNRLAKKYHPDKEMGNVEKMKEINEAYRQLINDSEPDT